MPKGKNETTVETTEAPKKERKMLTPAERVAKLEADLAAAKAKAEAREQKGRNAAIERRAKLIAKRDELNATIDQLTELIGDGESTVDSQPETEQVEDESAA